MTKKSRKTLAAIVIGVILLILVLKKPAAPRYAAPTYATPTTERTLGSSTIVPEELKELPTPTTERTLGSSTIVAKDETGLAMPSNQVPVWSIARGWGSTTTSGGVVVTQAKHGMTVTILERKGLDIKIRISGNTGWVRGWFVQKYRAECLRDYK